MTALGMTADTSNIADNAPGGGGDMSQNTIGSIDAGEVDAEVAERAARRIRDYLRTWNSARSRRRAS
jgi:hypothetical protein